MTEKIEMKNFVVDFHIYGGVWTLLASYITVRPSGECAIFISASAMCLTSQSLPVSQPFHRRAACRAVWSPSGQWCATQKTYLIHCPVQVSSTTVGSSGPECCSHPLIDGHTVLITLLANRCSKAKENCCATTILDFSVKHGRCSESPGDSWRIKHVVC